MAGSFTHLHQHTEYSMLDGASRVQAVVAAAVADGQPALGITDHGVMYGVLEFYKECRAQGIKPVIGIELYQAAESRHERPRRSGGKVDDAGGDTEGGNKLYYHLTALAETTEGYRNLMKLSSEAYLSGYYYKPRADWELLEQHHRGIIATTGCLGGVVLQALLQGDEDLATTRAARLQDIFGRDSMFVELQDHGIPEQRRTNPQLLRLARRLRAPLLATNDGHYVHQADALAHDALLCVQTGALLADENRFRFSGDQHYLKTAAEMRSLFSELPEACDNTLWIAERAGVEIEFGKPQLPEFPLPSSFTSQAGYLRHLVEEGARDRYGAAYGSEVQQRIDHELGVIEDMGFSAYFLVVWDLIRHARSSGIRVGPGRGSAAGSCVSYCLKIVDLDPIRYDLLFERFLNPARKQMPDIDMDFDSRYRGEMIRYAAERYGWDHVAQIITFSTIKARAAVRDAARVLGYPYSVGDRVAKAMPPLVMGRDTPLWACFERQDRFADGYQAAGELRAMYDSELDVQKVVDVARGLEGLRRGDSIHAAAVVITNRPLTEHLPIQRKPDGANPIEQAPIVTQYEMGGVEELGLLKMDFLGLRNLDVIEMTLDQCERTLGHRPDVDGLALDDDRTFEMLRRGESIGVFQFEGAPMRTLMRALAPTSFDDIAALTALYRPGPMAANMHNDYADRKNGRKRVSYFHPDAEKVLGATYGLCVYQEQMMQLARLFAGFSMEEADNLRKAAGKKKREIMARERAKFVVGCDATGYGVKLGNDLFDMIEPFADYAFNKSHSVGYGFVAYQTAWLKANYPVQYFAALLTSVKDDKDKTAVYLSECRTMGIEVEVPDVNASASDFVANITPGSVGSPLPGGTGTIPFGLSAIRNVGEGLTTRVVEERDRRGPFSDFYDFCQRVDPLALNKRTIESLIKAGAFDNLGHPRRGLLQVFEQVVDRTLQQRKEADQGIMSLFGELDVTGGGFDDTRVPIPDVEFDKKGRLAHEKEMLGLYLSDHPLLGCEGALKRATDCTIAELREQAPADGADGGRGGDSRWVGGVVTGLTRKFTRKGEPMATFCLEDLQSAIQVLVFPRTMNDVGHLLVDDAVLCVKGRLDTRDDEPSMVCLEIRVPDLVLDGGPPLRVRVPAGQLSEDGVDRLKALLLEHPGESAVYLHVDTLVLRLPAGFAVDLGGSLLGELRVLFGPDCLV
ncbi:MAG: DNA polymerase III alpha subunit [uncultured Acidimicrobiales bacterium]|uniref:DNA polymerase III subunit alpha n=1 Tax=uncultured Acidimicrobiales bacterium TaxID=310071 RepID=A0A6J4H059_9ACTN|nr:MAG: DNA polymerase III alpha subunit [uncultured Acidimicrobiales bacterium]